MNRSEKIQRIPSSVELANRCDEKGRSMLMRLVAETPYCEILICLQIDVNLKDNDGNTALHYAAKGDHVETVKVLLNNGANPDLKNISGDDVLTTAAIWCSERTGRYLMAFRYARDLERHRPINFARDMERQIDFLWLLGAQLIDNKNNLPLAFEVWREAIRKPREFERYGFFPTTAPITACYSVTQVATFDDFNLLWQDEQSVYMHALLLRERILGPLHEQTFYHLLKRIIACSLTTGSERWLVLAKRAFDISTNAGLTSEERFERLRIFSDMYCFFCPVVLSAHVDRRLPCDYTTAGDILLNVLREMIGTCKRRIIKDKKNGVDNESWRFLKYFRNIIFCFLNLKWNKSQIISRKKLVSQVVQLRLRDNDGRTLLMYVLSNEDFCSRYEIFFNGRPLIISTNENLTPAETFMELNNTVYLNFANAVIFASQQLLECGVDVNERDSEGNTVLHLFTNRGYSFILNNDRVIELAKLYLEYGAHIDAKNIKGKESGAVLSILGLKILSPLRLDCLAARTIRSKNIPFVGIIPNVLIPFVELH